MSIQCRICNRIQDLHTDIVIDYNSMIFRNDEIMYLPACFNALLAFLLSFLKTSFKWFYFTFTFKTLEILKLKTIYKLLFVILKVCVVGFVVPV